MAAAEGGEAEEFLPSDPCFARYTDNHFYLATVLSVDAVKQEYRVVFDEYDEEATVQRSDLRKPKPSPFLSLNLSDAVTESKHEPVAASQASELAPADAPDGATATANKVVSPPRRGALFFPNTPPQGDNANNETQEPPPSAQRVPRKTPQSGGRSEHFDHHLYPYRTGYLRVSEVSSGLFSSRRTWHERFCVLNDGVDQFEIFHHEGDYQTNREPLMRLALLRSEAEFSSKAEHAFTFLDTQAKKSTLFQADSKESAEEWVGYLRVFSEAVLAKLESTKSQKAWKCASNCFNCEVKFTLLRPRSHCRNCVRSFCRPCSSKTFVVPELGKDPVRVCDACFFLLGGEPPKAPQSKTPDASSKTLAHAPPRYGGASSPTASGNNKEQQSVSAPATTGGGEHASLVEAKQTGDAEPRRNKPRPSPAEAQILKKRKVRTHLLNELVTTEATYVARLRALCSVYLQGLQTKAILSPNDIDKIFSNVPLLADMHAKFLHALQEQLADFSKGTEWAADVGDVFLLFAPYFKLYVRYVNNHPTAVETMTRLQNTNRRFASFLRDASKTPASLGFGLNDFLIEPIQRIPRYRLLLVDILKNTTKQHLDITTNTSNALALVEEIATFINESVKTAENRKSVLEIQQQLVPPKNSKEPVPDLVAPHRFFVEKGTFLHRDQEGMGVKEVVLVLFNDMLLSAIPASGEAKTFSLLHRYKINRQFVVRPIDFNEGEFPMQIVAHQVELDGSSTGNTVITLSVLAESQVVRARWLKTLAGLVNSCVQSELLTASSRGDEALVTQLLHQSLLGDTANPSRESGGAFEGRASQLLRSGSVRDVDAAQRFVRAQQQAGSEGSKGGHWWKDVDVDHQDAHGWTSLMHAASHGHVGIVRQLLDAGASIDHPNSREQTPLMTAVKDGRVEVATLLIERKADLLRVDQNGRYALEMVSAEQEALSKRMLNGMLFLCCKRPDAHAVTLANILIPDILRESQERRRQGSRVLGLEEGSAALDLPRDEAGWTLLHHAAVHFLEGEGALKDAPFALDGTEALSVYPYDDTSEDLNKVSPLRLLKLAGCDIDAINNEGRTPLMECSRRGNLAALKWLIIEGADVRARCVTGSVRDGSRAQTAEDLAKTDAAAAVLRAAAKGETIVFFGRSSRPQPSSGRTPQPDARRHGATATLGSPASTDSVQQAAVPADRRDGSGQGAHGGAARRDGRRKKKDRRSKRRKNKGVALATEHTANSEPDLTANAEDLEPGAQLHQPGQGFSVLASVETPDLRKTRQALHGPPSTSKRPVCKLVAYGLTCRKGDACPFSHELGIDGEPDAGATRRQQPGQKPPIGSAAATSSQPTSTGGGAAASSSSSADRGGPSPETTRKEDPTRVPRRARRSPDSSAARSSQPPAAVQVCKLFQLGLGCRKGEKCPFLHSAVTTDAQ